MDQARTTDRQVRRVLLIEGSANCLVLTLKVIIGLSTGSMAIMADAFHSLTDIANNIVAWIVIYFSSQPPDREHPYGHRKFETIAVFILASILIVIAFEISLNAIRNKTSEVASSGIELIVMLSVLVVNILLAIWQRMWANRLNSDIIRADATHTFADVLTTCVVIVGWQLSAMGYAWIDRLCAIAVSLVIVYLAFGLFKRSLPILVDGFAIEPAEIKNAL
jgi:cation diffusion facilitator family transporter